MAILRTHRPSLILCLAFGGVAVLRAQQPAATAGSTRPNIHIIKDLPEAQLFPVMNAIATS